MRHLFSLGLLCLCINHLQAATIYKVIMPDGKVIFTDKPQKGAVKVEALSKINVTPKLPASTQVPVSTSNPINNAQTLPVPKETYQLKMLAPTQEQTIRDNNGSVEVIASVVPEPKAVKYKLFLNGALAQEQNLPQFNLTNLERGEHNIQVQMTGETGRLIASTQIVTFYLHKASLINRAN